MSLSFDECITKINVLYNDMIKFSTGEERSVPISSQIRVGYDRIGY